MCFLRSSGVRHRKWKLLGVKLPDFTVGMLSHCIIRFDVRCDVRADVRASYIQQVNKKFHKL